MELAPLQDIEKHFRIPGLDEHFVIHAAMQDPEKVPEGCIIGEYDPVTHSLKMGPFTWTLPDVLDNDGDRALPLVLNTTQIGGSTVVDIYHEGLDDRNVSYPYPRMVVVPGYVTVTDPEYSEPFGTQVNGSRQSFCYGVHLEPDGSEEDMQVVYITITHDLTVSHGRRQLSGKGMKPKDSEGTLLSEGIGGSLYEPNSLSLIHI